MISNGADTNRYRDIAVNVAADVAHLFTYELGQPVGIRQWDYRRDNPRVVPAGALAARSLSMVERSECLLAILGATVPNITSQEVIRAFERRQAGERVDFWLFLNPDQKTSDHDLSSLMAFLLASASTLSTLHIAPNWSFSRVR